MPSIKSMLSGAVLASVASAKTIKVTAGDNSFDPDTVEAAKGDIVEFHFDGGNHSVASGLYDFACTPSNLGSGFFSGFVEADDGANDVFRVTINSTDPIAFYSSQDTECSEGMVGIINPDDDHTLDDYKERASELSGKGNSPPDAYGGELVEDDDSNDNGNDDNDDNSSDNNDDNNDDNSNDNNDDSAAGAFSIPVFGLLSAVAVAFALA